MHEKQVLERAFAMPLTSPAYPPGPYRFVNREYLIITYRTDCGFRGLRPGIPIERDHAFRSKAATCSDEGGRGVVAGMRSWVRFSWLRQDWRAAQ